MIPTLVRVNYFRGGAAGIDPDAVPADDERAGVVGCLTRRCSRTGASVAARSLVRPPLNGSIVERTGQSWRTDRLRIVGTRNKRGSYSRSTNRQRNTQLDTPTSGVVSHL